MSEKQKLQDVWRTCNKIRAAIFHLGLDLWDYYKPLDPENNLLISETKFVAVLASSLKDIIGLSDKEIRKLADYFRVQDGRILYKQFCDVIHGNVPDFNRNDPIVTGLEWEDPSHVNTLKKSELRRLDMILTQIAVHINRRKLVLRPYFQDYELIAKNCGTVTIVHFGRVLSFLGITVASDEFCLLVKRFAKDSYTMNYVAFVEAVDKIQSYLEQHGMMDLGGHLFDQFPDRIIVAELPKLPRPEIGKVLPSQVFGKQTVFHPVMDPPKPIMSQSEVIHRLQRHIFEHRIRVTEFFVEFDPMNSGCVTVSQFRRVLDAIQVSSLGRLNLAEAEFDEIITLYKDPNDPDRVCWRTFADDVDHVFTIKGLHKLPNVKVESPPQHIKELPRKGTENWHCKDMSVRELCEHTLQIVRRRVCERAIPLRQFFKAHDKHNHGHVSRVQMRQSFTTAAVLLSEEEMCALEVRYNDDLGFNYKLFLQDLEASPIPAPLYDEMLKKLKHINSEKLPKNIPKEETNIVLILAKIKAKVVRERVKVTEFMRQFDLHNELCIKKTDFIRGLDQLRCNLTCTEMATVAKVFQAPSKPDFVEYARFGETVEEAVAKGALERAPLSVPVQHVPSEACNRTFLNFDERIMLAQAMDKLCYVHQPNLEELFQDFDKENIGTVSKHCLEKALSVRHMLVLLSSREVDVIHKCFSVERGGRLEINYRVFLNALHLLKESKNIPPV